MTHKSYATSSMQEDATVVLVSREELLERTQALIDSVAQRAYELYGNRGCVSGGDLDDWFRAESELLTTLRLELSESGEYVIARADVSEFAPHDIRVCVEPTILRIVSTPKDRTKTSRDATESDFMRSKQLLHVAEIPNEVNPAKATVIVTGSIMEIVMPKASKESVGRRRSESYVV